MCGSSPLARGLPWWIVSCSAMCRIIPARAGFTPQGGKDLSHGRDHPRSRGVYYSGSVPKRTMCGSSPLARGLPLRQAAARDQDGIIPARAGFTQLPPGGRDGPGDHPRSRGVYTETVSPRDGEAGSSPLARGLLGACNPERALNGIIPARAGFTRPDEGLFSHPGDHPRSRGVYGRPGQGRPHGRGSSPLARGLRELRGVSGPHFRIIPARAGFTAARSSWTRLGRDHPRSRGVYTWAAAPSCPTYGSSPLARGLLDAGGDVGTIEGIIPARAGFTVMRRSAPPSMWDHPRSRGVY